MGAQQAMTAQVLCVVVATASGFRAGLRAGPAAARLSPPVAAIASREAVDREDWQAAELLHETFGGATLFYYGSLRVPSLNANVFFKPVNEPAIGVAYNEDGDSVVGVAQLIRAELRPAIGVPNVGSRPVAYVQSVAVAESARRQGVARSLMDWCIKNAKERWRGEAATTEMWLAVAVENAPALALYEALGFTRRNVAMGNVLMSRSLCEDDDDCDDDMATAPSASSPTASTTARSSSIQACLQPAEETTEAAVMAPPPSDGVGWGVLASNVAVQSLYVGVAALGIGLLLFPFGGPSPLNLLGLAPPWAGDCAPWAGQQCASVMDDAARGGGASAAFALLRSVLEVGLGLGVAYAELLRLRVRVPGLPRHLPAPPGSETAASETAASEMAASETTASETAASETTVAPDSDAVLGASGTGEDRSGWLNYGPAQAEQMRPLYEISAGEPSLLVAACAIGAWQLVVAIAEELYYRGFVESAGVLAFSPLSSAGIGGVCIREAIPLLVSAALFGLVHTEFVQEPPPEGAEGRGGNGAANAPQEPETGAPLQPGQPVEESKAYWFRVTALYGVLYSLLYVVSGHRLLASTACHAGLNVGQALRDWEKMRATPDAELQRIFTPRQQDGP